MTLLGAIASEFIGGLAVVGAIGIGNWTIRRIRLSVRARERERDRAE
ncbi:hypothetical protein [Streptomyces sp. NPDC057199]